MHLLRGDDLPLVTEGAVDLEQQHGDVLFLSSADSELNSVAFAARRLSDLRVRVSNIARLSHPLSVDTYLRKTVQGSSLVIVRLLGGRAYWRYGVERLATSGVACVFLPGDERQDDDLRSISAFDD